MQRDGPNNNHSKERFTCLETQNDNGKSIPFEFWATEGPYEW